MGLSLSPDDLLAMEARTEGWIAGLQLAAIALQSHVSMQGINDVHGFVSAFTGSHYYIMDYLTEEVLKRLPEKMGLFLLQTSILGRMCGPLCEAVVEANAIEQTNGQAMLEDLEHRNLFLIPLDDERRWYRYHHLFADVLNRRLEQLIYIGFPICTAALLNGSSKTDSSLKPSSIPWQQATRIAQLN